MSLDSYVTLGRSGLRVSPFTLGTMTFGEDFGWGSSPEVSADILAAYLDRGGNSIDTANIYTAGHSERIIGDYLAAHPGLRDGVVLGTKFFGNLRAGDPNGGGVGRKAIVQQLENSLRRLRTDYVDLYWVHNYDPTTPIEETMRTLDDLVTAGKIRYVGLSDLPAWRVAEAALTSRFHDRVPITALQLEYSLLERTSEGELLPAAQHLGIGVLPWSPLKNGFLSGKYSSARPSTTARGNNGYFQPPTAEEYVVIDAVNDIAAEIGASSAAVALAWVQGRPGITSTIIGARTLEQFTANIAGLDLVLGDEHRARLDELSAPTLDFPAAANLHAPMMQFGGMSVDGIRPPAHPALVPVEA
ncbi:aldo/keto reductase [Kutzneria buriramensis]|uniref:Aryl-alcohol dehydrogenase-like predicted oxidoreductase n=1 Tax=Kutzneria buriramensis TaxID=1045776 RepID=A0A3E0I0S9_9PSEU|nr:aldo/keto reductase [Kutzneria buriramensis]REH52231.1 aryl-alcohol dehydrogenase-like predicted oxidoreductase [Kutzneria buriramensis]